MDKLEQVTTLLRVYNAKLCDIWVQSPDTMEKMFAKEEGIRNWLAKQIVDLDQPISQSDLLTDRKKILEAMGFSRDWKNRRYINVEIADLRKLAKAQFQHLISLGWKSPSEIETLIKELHSDEKERFKLARADERAKVLKEIEKYIEHKYFNDGLGAGKNYSRTATYKVAKNLLINLVLAIDNLKGKG